MYHQPGDTNQVIYTFAPMSAFLLCAVAVNIHIKPQMHRMKDGVYMES